MRGPVATIFASSLIEITESGDFACIEDGNDKDKDKDKVNDEAPPVEGGNNKGDSSVIDAAGDAPQPQSSQGQHRACFAI
jgi:hypothetical protein